MRRAIFAAAVALAACKSDAKPAGRGSAQGSAVDKLADKVVDKVVDEASKLTAERLRAERNKVTAYAPGEAPISIEALSATQAVLPMLGPSPEGWPASNYLPINFQLKVAKALTTRLKLMIKATCYVGSRNVTTVTAPPIDLEALAAGATLETEASPFLKDGFVGDAEGCELAFFLDAQQPGVPPNHLVTRCWSGGQVTDGDCQRPRIPVRDTRLRITGASLGHVEGALAFAYDLLIGGDLAGDEQLEVAVTCDAGGKPVTGGAQPIADFQYAAEGETLRVLGKVHDLGAELGDCEATLRAKPIASGPAIELGTVCLRGGVTTTTEGACP